MAFLFKLLGIWNTIVEFLTSMIKAILDFAKKYPWQFITIILVICLIFTSWHINSLNSNITDLNKTIETKNKFIKDQTARLDEYVDALEKEKDLLKKVVKNNNDAVANLKKVADKALSDAQKEIKNAEKQTQSYKSLADKYKKANVSSGTAEERIKREEETTDSFIVDWRKLK